MKTISIIIPIYNERGGIKELHNRINETIFKYISQYNFEIIFVNDGSKDDSHSEIKKLTENGTNIKCLEFSRNFGKEVALSAGLQYCQGDCAIMIDADLQHPPELIPEFIKKWEAGGEVVIGVRAISHEDDWLKKFGSWLFYKIMNYIGETKIAPRATDFRLLDRMVINEFNKLTENSRLTRGLIAWLGFKREFIEFNSPKRKYGKPTYSKSKLLKLALTTFISQSLFPLKLAGYLGIIIMILSGLIGIHIIINEHIHRYTDVLYFSEIAQLAILLIFLVGLILSCLGLIALYIGNIQHQVMGRPLYVIRKKINF